MSYIHKLCLEFLCLFLQVTLCILTNVAALFQYDCQRLGRIAWCSLHYLPISYDIWITETICLWYNHVRWRHLACKHQLFSFAVALNGKKLILFPFTGVFTTKVWNSGTGDCRSIELWWWWWWLSCCPLLETASHTYLMVELLQVYRFFKNDCLLNGRLYWYIGLVKIMLTLMDYFSPADRRTPWMTD
jgi:hypothetical protein